MSEPLFLSLDSAALAREIARAENNVCYAAPGIMLEPARALVEFALRKGPEFVAVSLDYSAHVLRMGFGEEEAVEFLRLFGIDVRKTEGLRTGLLVVDDAGFIFTPIALMLEADQRTITTPNAMRLSPDQVKQALIRLSPATRSIAIAKAETEEEREEIRKQAEEVPSEKVEDDDVKRVKKDIKEAPPVKFDVARQAQVYSARLQFVEINLIGTSIGRSTLSIPPDIMKLGGATDLEGRLRTTFRVIEKSNKLSSQKLERELNDIRKNFTGSLGKKGRVVLKSAKPHLEKKLTEFRGKLRKHQQEVEAGLQKSLNASRKQVVAYYLPIVKKDPPDALLGQGIDIDDAEAGVEVEAWLDRRLEKIFPEAKKLIKKMELHEDYKDVTYQTLKDKKFLELLEKAFPEHDWEKAHDEYIAAKGPGD